MTTTTDTKRRLVDQDITEHNTTRWLTVAEAARHIHVSRQHLYRWMKDRGLPAHGHRGALRFDAAELDAWLRAGGAK